MLRCHPMMGWMLLAGWAVSLGTLSAQVPATPAPAPTAEASPAETPPAAAPRPDVRTQFEIIYLKDKDGKLVPILLGPELERVLSAIAEAAQPPAPAALPYSFSRVTLTGEADAERVQLTAVLQLQVDAPHGPVRVPVRFNEGLRDFQHEGPGQIRFDGLDNDTGYRWWFSESGLHTLTLTLSLPIRKDLPNRRLQCALPAAAVSSLKLKVPLPRITARADERSSLEVTAREGASEISLIGIGPRLDLTWQPQPDTTGIDPVLEARTSISLSVDEESILWEANQRVLAFQGSFNEIKVRLPAGYELLKVEGASYKEHSLDPNNVNQVIVVLKESSPGPVDLRWTIRADLPTGGNEFPIEGFEVEKARIQTGTLAVRAVGAYRVTKVDREDRFVQRINVSDLAKAVPPVPTQGEVASAFRVLKQPFRLLLRYDKTEPYVTVKPNLFAKFSADRVELEAEYRFQVFRGSVDEVAFKWPGWRAEGWKIQPVDAPGLVEQTIISEQSDGAQIRVRFIERTSGEVTLRLLAQRTLTGMNGPVGISFPMPIASSRLPADLVIAPADNVELDFRATGETTARPVTTATADAPALPESIRDLQRLNYISDSTDQTYSASLAVHPRRILTESELEVVVEAEQTELRQTLRYDVAYERLSQLVVSLPRRLAGRCRFSLPDGTELIPVETGTATADSVQVRLTLDRPRIGEIEVIAQTTLPIETEDNGDPEKRVLPLIRATEAEFSVSRIHLRSDPSLRTTLAGDQWKKQSGGAGTETWQAASPLAAATLSVEAVGMARKGGTVVDKILVRAGFDSRGRSLCRAQFRLLEVRTVPVITLPPGARAQQVWWNRQRLTAAELSGLSDGGTEMKFDLPPEILEETGLLTVDYSLPSSAPFVSSEPRVIQTPRVSAEMGQCVSVVELSLPSDQLLFVPPPGWIPLFRWQRNGLLWSRREVEPPLAYAQWIGSEDGPPNPWLSNGSSEGYRFSSLAAPTVAKFRTVSIWFLVAIGAGPAFALGFLITHWRPLRHLLTFLIVALTVTIAGLWYAEPVLVLAQPAAFGLILAVVAAALQGAVRRLRRPRGLTLTSPSGFLSPPSSVQPVTPAVVGSNESTSVRGAPGAQPVSGYSA